MLNDLFSNAHQSKKNSRVISVLRKFSGVLRESIMINNNLLQCLIILFPRIFKKKFYDTLQTV